MQAENSSPFCPISNLFFSYVLLLYILMDFTESKFHVQSVTESDFNSPHLVSPLPLSHLMQSLQFFLKEQIICI